ncbi:MAG: hypothetical protein ABSB14_06160 [Candidatus Sulfotelmatobacter sp.]|jgi:hypothetical protein
MTLAELEDSLPNGFHDSALKGLSIDYMRRTIRLDMSLKVGDSDGPREQRDDVRDAEIEVSGVVFFAERYSGRRQAYYPGETIDS